MEALNLRQSSRSFSPKQLDPQTLSNLLWAGYGFNREGMRTVPSANNRQEIDLYVMFKDGIYMYDAKANELKLVAKGDFRKGLGGQQFAHDAALNLICVTNLSKGSGRETSSFILQNVYLFCASEGLGAVIRGSFDKNLLAEYLKLTKDQEVVLTQAVGYIQFEKAEFIVEPEIFIQHTEERTFIGPGTFLFDNGNLIMAAPWGRPPTNFEQLAAKFPVPMIYQSTNGGRTWTERGRMNMSWNLPGMISDGGITFLRLKNGRLAFLANRHVEGLHGGGLPIISFSDDDGKTWTPAKTIGDPEGVWYVMNERLIQMSNGRLVVPVSHMEVKQGSYEGFQNLGLCFFSDDNGVSWTKSLTYANIDDGRGMAEPCVAEIGNNKLIMLARTGSGYLYRSFSEDGGFNWSKPEATELRSACSSLTLKTLPDGRLIVFYDHAKPINKGAFFPRTPLVYAVSADKGKTWSSPILVDDDGFMNNDRQNIYPSISFTKEGMLVIWSTHAADPQGSFANGGAMGWKIGGGKRAILKYPKKDL